MMRIYEHHISRLTRVDIDLTTMNGKETYAVPVPSGSVICNLHVEVLSLPDQVTNFSVGTTKNAYVFIQEQKLDGASFHYRSSAMKVLETDEVIVLKVDKEKERKLGALRVYVEFFTPTKLPADY